MNTLINNVRKGIMGTVEFELKTTRMKNFQNFICYPIDNKTDNYIKVQSETRIGKLYVKTDKQRTIELSKSHSNGAYFHHLNTDKLQIVTLSEKDYQTLKTAIQQTSSKVAGKKENGIVSSNNNQAKNIFEI